MVQNCFWTLLVSITMLTLVTLFLCEQAVALEPITEDIKNVEEEQSELVYKRGAKEPTKKSLPCQPEKPSKKPSKGRDVKLPICKVEKPRDLKQEQKNKDLIRTFYQKLFGDLDLSAIEEYVSEETYIQHNPYVADGRQAMIDGLTLLLADKKPGVADIRRISADGDLVYVHFKDPTGEEPWQFQAVLDIFRIRDGKITEHWDVIQANPSETAANDHPFF